MVEYAPGHHAEAAAVARALGVSQSQPLEQSVGSLAPGASVVVVAGSDKAPGGGEGSGTSSPGGTTSSGGEPSAGGESSSAGGATP